MKIDLGVVMNRIVKVGDVSNSNLFKRCPALDACPMLVNLVGKQKLLDKILLCISKPNFEAFISERLST